MNTKKNYLTTKEQFKELQQNKKTEDGYHHLLQQFQLEMLEKLVIQSKINAEHSKRKTLQKCDALAAIKMTKEIPRE